MLHVLTRTSIFESSLFADNFIAEMQQSYASSFDTSIPSERAMVKKYYDHLQPFNSLNPPIDDGSVIAYQAKTEEDYNRNLPVALQAFLSDVGIAQLYLLDFTKYSLLDFPFQNFRKRNQFKRWGGKKKDDVGYLLHVNSLHKILPLFFFSKKYDVPVIFLITAQGNTPLCLRLCDDGNFHLNYHRQHHDLIQKAAIKSSFAIGDIDLCSKYSLYYLAEGE